MTQNLILTGAALLALPPIVWLWHGYIPRGMLVFLFGDPGTGKTATALDLAKRLALGWKWPDGTLIAKSGKTLWVDAEGAKLILAERIRNYGIPEDYILLPPQKDIFSGFQLDTAGFALLESAILQSRPDLVVIDSLAASHSRDENSTRDMKVLLEKLNSMAATHNCAMLVIHHSNKPQGPEGRKRPLDIHCMRGAGHLASVARSIVGVEERNGVKRLQHLKSNVGQLQKPLAFTINANGVEYHEAPPEPASLSKTATAKNLILAQMQTSGGVAQSAAMDEFLRTAGISPATAQRAKEELGIVSEKSGDSWVWRLPMNNC